MTRDCIDPWVYVEIEVDGGVSLSCVRKPVGKPVGNLANQPLASILHGNEARTLRHQLLSGELDTICRACGLRGTISPSNLQQKVKELYEAAAVPEEFDPGAYADANPDVREAKIDPTQHFLDWGRIEGRPLKPRVSQSEPDA